MPRIKSCRSLGYVIELVKKKCDLFLATQKCLEIEVATRVGYGQKSKWVMVGLGSPYNTSFVFHFIYFISLNIVTKILILKNECYIIIFLEGRMYKKI